MLKAERTVAELPYQDWKAGLLMIGLVEDRLRVSQKGEEQSHKIKMETGMKVMRNDFKSLGTRPPQPLGKT